MTEMFGRKLAVDYVYALTDSETGEVRYIGVTRNPEQRLKYHCGRGADPNIKYWIASLKQQGRSIKMLILQEVTYPSMGREYYERQWIYHYLQQGAALYNYQALMYNRLPPTVERASTIPRIVLDD